MAYMNQAKKAVIKAALDKVLKPAGFKYSLAVKNHMSISCTILAGPLDFIGNFKAVTGDKFKVIPGREIDSLQVNMYWINDHFSGIYADILAQCADALKAADYYDRSDAMIDYFDTAYYMDLNIGRWDKPYQLTGAPYQKPAASGSLIDYMRDAGRLEFIHIGGAEK